MKNLTNETRTCTFGAPRVTDEKIFCKRQERVSLGERGRRVRSKSSLGV